ncbi:carbohydrate binding family 9 domain-containing protein [Thalassotalea sp. M1531]|uniref:Carbohydrate binding family 9 domain-containing protein n=1 Tax=Thalassotalea algicola TaxID=2716224 RepID=A0A7Y0LDD9_9GAMM|nr:carbohydrate binding family 9 domain-containing protein [Thalassotalea algicola]NMP32499.1 carbohydrate binding family 9 domain-containing protein [Thalassotalea algicola]
MQLKKKTMQVVIVAFALMASFFALASDNSAIDIPRIAGEISIDGQLNEPQWKTAKRVNINIVTRPYDNTPSPVKTEALLMEDGGTFYLGFIAHDPNPEEIRAFLKDRDRSWGDDIVGIKIDTYNDQRTAYRFMVNPLGVQIDGVESEITKKESDSWDGIWDSAGQITDFGYIVEMALPLRMLNFNEDLCQQDWGIELVRFYPRTERLRISNTSLDRGNSCELCQLVKASGFTGAKQGQNLTVTPSLVLGKSEERDDYGTWQDDETTEPSLDIRWGITPDILLNATINPDFSTVESDRAQLNINNNFALFNEEKRPFFLDNADYFDSNYNLVYTRNINAPEVGAKLTARKDNHSIGLFVTNDETTNFLIPGNRGSSIAEIDDKSEAAAFRYRNSYSKDLTLGWISTLRTSDDYQNMVHGIDARYRATQYDVVKFQSLYSNTEYPDDLFEQFCNADEVDDCQQGNVEPCDLSGCDINEQVLRTQDKDNFSGNAFRFGYYHNDSNWHYKVTYDKQNAGFRGDLGFIARADFNRLVLGGDRKWYAEPGDWWTQVKIYSDWDISHNDDGEMLEKEFDINFQLNAQHGTHARFWYSNRDLVGNRVDQSSLAIDGNTTLFTENEYGFFAETKPTSGFYINTRLNWGDKVDLSNNRLGKKKEFRPTINWNVNQHLELKLRHTYRELDAESKNVFIARLTDFRATYQFNVQSFLRLTFIYNNTSRNQQNYPLSDPDDITPRSKDLSAQLLYAYKINPQTVFYLGYSEHQDGEGDFSDLKQDLRSVFMKFSYAWIR